MNNIPLWVWLVAGLALIGGGAAVYTQRGLRLNNPGNIELGDPWQGMAPVQKDSRFITFVNPEYGIRAMAVTLKNYQRLYGINTIAKIISRWAPPEDFNDTAAYIANVQAITGIPANAQVNVADILPRLIPAIIKQEQGIQPYSNDILLRGIALAA